MSKILIAVLLVFVIILVIVGYKNQWDYVKVWKNLTRQNQKPIIPTPKPIIPSIPVPDHNAPEANTGQELSPTSSLVPIMPSFPANPLVPIVPTPLPESMPQPSTPFMPIPVNPLIPIIPKPNSDSTAQLPLPSVIIPMPQPPMPQPSMPAMPQPSTPFMPIPVNPLIPIFPSMPEPTEVPASNEELSSQELAPMPAPVVQIPINPIGPVFPIVPTPMVPTAPVTPPAPLIPVTPPAPSPTPFKPVQINPSNGRYPINPFGF